MITADQPPNEPIKQLTSQTLPQDLLNIDYQNIQNTQQLHTIVSIYQYKQHQILEQIKEYSAIIARNKQEHIVIVQKMKSLQKQYARKNSELVGEIQGVKEEHQKRVKEIVEEHERAVKQRELSASQYVSQESQRIKKYVAEMQQYSQVEIEEVGYINEIKNKAQQLIDRQYQHHDNMNKHQTKQQQQNKQLILQNLQMVSDLKKNVKMYANNVVFQFKSQNQDKNYQLKSRLLVLQEQLSKLRKQRNQALANKKQTKINVSINQEQLEQYKAVGSIQKSKIKHYNDKIQYTKKNITSQLAKLENKIKEKKRKWENQMKGLRIKMFNLEKNKEELKVNLEKYRTLGETILMQREEVQDFFLQAIESCKKQMLDTQAMQDNNDKQYGQRVDIDELLPRDKHRILTNLYTKLALGPK